MRLLAVAGGDGSGAASTDVRTTRIPTLICPGDDVYPSGGGVAAVGVPGAMGAGRTTSVTVGLNYLYQGGSVAEWLACWTQAQKGPG